MNVDDFYAKALVMHEKYPLLTVDTCFNFAINNPEQSETIAPSGPPQVSLSTSELQEVNQSLIDLTYQGKEFRASDVWGQHTGHYRQVANYLRFLGCEYRKYRQDTLYKPVALEPFHCRKAGWQEVEEGQNYQFLKNGHSIEFDLNNTVIIDNKRRIPKDQVSIVWVYMLGGYS